MLERLFDAFTPAAYGIWSLVFMALGWVMKEWRANRKLSLDDRVARREGYEAQVHSLQDENRALRKDLTDMRLELDANRQACQVETDQLRDHLVASENRTSALLRKIADLAIRVSNDQPDLNVVASILQLAIDADLRDGPHAR